jgi:phage repressor protein C with HTH and peptisase S24 domain
MPRTATDDLFVARVVGRSMEPLIADGSWCLFTRRVGGSRDGRRLVVQHRDIADPDHGGTYTLKVYRRPPEMRNRGEEQLEPIVLQPLNPDYSPIELGVADEDAVQVVGELLDVLRAEGSGR